MIWKVRISKIKEGIQRIISKKDYEFVQKRILTVPKKEDTLKISFCVFLPVNAFWKMFFC